VSVDIRFTAMAIKSVVVLLGLLVLVQGQLPDTVGSTDPMNDALSFRFADGDSSGAPADVERIATSRTTPSLCRRWTGA
jgi:hypothetical protein